MKVFNRGVWGTVCKHIGTPITRESCAGSWSVMEVQFLVHAKIEFVVYSGLTKRAAVEMKKLSTASTVTSVKLFAPTYASVQCNVYNR